MTMLFIIEDDPTLLKLYKLIMTEAGHEILGTARNGQEGVRKFAKMKKKPDIILMDHRMPVKNGLEAAEEILKIDKDARIVFLSADSSIRKKALSMGALWFQSKPFSYDVLEKILDNCMTNEA